MFSSKNKKYIFDRAMKWIKANSLDSQICEGKGITVTSNQRVIYPEVTGYYIPSLIAWGERELAFDYAKYLISSQQADGSWLDSAGKDPYVFDSAQILKGLLAIRRITEGGGGLTNLDAAIIKGADWILSNMQPDGRLTTPSKDAWGNNENFCSELIHVYCLSPLKEAGEIFNRQDYAYKAYKILDYYKRTQLEKIKNFSLLSHFYAYVMEGLFDMGDIDLCRESMQRITDKYQRYNGGIPGLKDYPSWVCSTGMFQLALVWYKLGEREKGDKIFYYACSLQNESGGWFGSYYASLFSRLHIRRRARPYYFPRSEISWANKFFLDALEAKIQLEFKKSASTYGKSIGEDDGRLLAVDAQLKEILSNAENTYGGGGIIADIGCGKGRYLKHFTKRYPANTYYAVDLTTKNFDEFDANYKCIGSLTNIPFSDNFFDFIYSCESFEHAINMEGAFRELYRVTKPGGCFMIIDKPVEKLGKLKIYEWEAWIDDADIKRYTEECGGSLNIIPSLKYENGKNDGLFRAWIIHKN